MYHEAVFIRHVDRKEVCHLLQDHAQVGGQARSFRLLLDHRLIVRRRVHFDGAVGCAGGGNLAAGQAHSEAPARLLCLEMGPGRRHSGSHRVIETDILHVGRSLSNTLADSPCVLVQSTTILSSPQLKRQSLSEWQFGNHLGADAGLDARKSCLEMPAFNPGAGQTSSLQSHSAHAFLQRHEPSHTDQCCWIQPCSRVLVECLKKPRRVVAASQSVSEELQAPEGSRSSQMPGQICHLESICSCLSDECVQICSRETLAAVPGNALYVHAFGQRLGACQCHSNLSPLGGSRQWNVQHLVKPARPEHSSRLEAKLGLEANPLPPQPSKSSASLILN